MGEVILPIPELPIEEQCADGKANINNAGQHIYHLPGQANYEQTLIDQEGEFFFCKEEEAIEAGFRKAKN